MATWLEAQPSLRRLLVDALMQAQSTLRRSGEQFLAPSFPGMVGKNDCRVLEGEPLIEHAGDGEHDNVVAAWPEQGLLAMRWPVLIFVLEGECDMRFGVIPTMRRHVPALPTEIGQYVVTARTGQFLLFPSHFPRPDGGDLHWERPGTASADSNLMWFIFFPTGCFIHFCTTRGQEHSKSKSIYLPTSRAFRLIEEVEAEILGHQAQWKTVARRYLEIMLLLLQRDLGSIQIETGLSETPRFAAQHDNSTPHPAHVVLQHACHFIEDRLQEPLRAPQIAAAVGISTPRLNQLFRKYLGTSITQYIISRRLEHASTLLGETNIAVSSVAAQSGFFSLEHFSRTFHKQAGVSPLAYRRRQQKDD